MLIQNNTYFTTIVYAKFGGQTESIMDNWKIVNYGSFESGLLDWVPKP